MAMYTGPEFITAVGKTGNGYEMGISIPDHSQVVILNIQGQW